MSILKIARMGHPVLRRRAEPIADPTARDVRKLVEDMLETLNDSEGAGLAAPQVHVSRRLVIFKPPPERAGQDRADGTASDPISDPATGPASDPISDPATDSVPLTVLINPEIEPLTEEQVLGWEACLSVPGLNGAVPRYTHIRYRGVTPGGQPIECEATGFHARVVQHECDHLDGILYPMRMTDLSLLVFSEELRRFTQDNREVRDDHDDHEDRDDPADESDTAASA